MVRAFNQNGEIWFIASDICKALELTNTSKAINALDDDEKMTLTNSYSHNGMGPQTYNIINESGLYSLVLRSRKPEAKKFKKWVTSEVLPSIRKTGTYDQQSKINAAINRRAHTLACEIEPIYAQKMHDENLTSIDQVENWYPNEDHCLSSAWIKLDPIEFPDTSTGNYPDDPNQHFTYIIWDQMLGNQKAPIFNLIQQIKEQGCDMSAAWQEYMLLKELLYKQNESFRFLKMHCERPHSVGFDRPKRTKKELQQIE